MKRKFTMRSPFNAAITSICLLIQSTQLSGQIASSTLIDQFQNYVIQHMQEKVYVHINRNDHITGEILWFNIYCRDGMTHKPLGLSTVAYIEIIDSENNSVLQTKVKLENAVGSGSLYLPSTLKTGKYTIIAYTNWMKNFNSDYFFHKEIIIVNTLKSAEQKISSIRNNKIEVDFFPEGGYLIEGVSGKLGFKISDSSGKGVYGKGFILNQNKDTILFFKPLKFGIGSFLFTPQSNDSYSAGILIDDQPLMLVKLPEIKKAGFGLMITDDPSGKIKIKVTNPNGILTAQLLIHTRQSIKVYDQKSTADKTCEFLIDKQLLGDGISHITILNQDGTPVCERLYFKKPAHQSLIKAEVDQKIYPPRRPVQLNIENKGDLETTLSVSVFRADSIVSNSNILSYLFLTSDLIGSIESPLYYFGNDQNVSVAIDNLMLTHGWRRFKWENIKNNNTQSIIRHQPEITDHIIQGKIINANRQPVPGKIAYLTNPGKTLNFYASRSDVNGDIKFLMKNYQSTGKMVAQVNNELDSTIKLVIESPFTQFYPKRLYHPLKINEDQEENLIKRSLSMQVQDTYYEKQTYFLFNKNELDTIPFYGQPDEQYFLDNYTRFPELIEVMREYIKGVWVRGRDTDISLRVHDKINKKAFDDDPLTLLDGVPIFNWNKLIEIDPLKVKKLDVVTRKYFYGPIMASGVINLSTYEGDLGGYNLGTEAIIIDYEGLQREREFFSPRYDKLARASRMPDERYQLLWAPQVRLTSTNNFEFFTSDVEGKYYVIIEGISKNGTPEFQSLTFDVEK